MRLNNQSVSSRFGLIIPTLLTIFIGAGIAAAQFTNPIFAWGTMTIIVIGLMLTGKPRVFLMLSLFYGVTKVLAISYVGNVLKYAEEIIFLGLVFFTYVHSATGKSPIYNGQVKKFYQIFVSLIILIILSGILNNSSKIGIIHFIKSYCMFGFVFLVTFKFMINYDSYKFIKFLEKLMIVQVILNLGWMAKINPISNKMIQSPNDFAIGTLGYANDVAYMTVMYFFVLLSVFQNSSNKKLKSITLVLLMAMSLGLFITYTFHAYLLLGVCFTIYYFVNIKNFRNKALPIIAAIIISIIFLVINSQLQKNSDSRNLSKLDSANLTKRYERMINTAKGQTYYNSFYRLPSEKGIYFFSGAGPANYMSTPALTRPTPLTFRYLGDFYLTFTGRQEMVGGSITQNPIVGICVIIGELGFIGFILYLALYIYPVVKVIRNINGGKYKHLSQKILAQAFPSAFMAFIIMNLLVDMWPKLSFVCVLWIWAALVWEPIKDKVSPNV